MRIFRVLLLNTALSILIVAFVAYLLKIDRLWLLPLPAILGLFSWPFFIGGTILIISAVKTLFIYGGATGAPGDPTKKLVTVGPYGWLRNPIYAGDFLLLFGASFYTRSLLLFLLTLVFIPILHFVVCLVEEPKTEKRFGDEYLEYKKQTPRWFPRISR